ncbi:hypothetical protein FH972_012059 [Carpinus fangiana]|uniref:Peptidase S8/S53 domain-containing protein n=1 Tax=Carpinus fangiana TaxID=176857 RepID=A0A5N6R3J0_9ROSI|nr:hypothetical protein FH972_012059 [Carpinus fangiana]
MKATAQLGNGEEFDGKSLFQPRDFDPKLLPLVMQVQMRGGEIGRNDKGKVVALAGGAAMILMNQKSDGFSTLADAHVLPATHTRGPSMESPGILKPDIIGPGVSILAAWPVPLDNNTNSKSTFNLISGTSMSCHHLCGIAALLKSSHPDWSPAAINSAIMTTADLLNLEGKKIVDERLLPADIFATGAGHVNPSKANNPGLVYDIQPDDYIPYLCGSQAYTRTVTNVGRANSTYTPDRVFGSSRDRVIEGFSQGYLKWVSDRYSVRSPISVIFE